LSKLDYLKFKDECILSKFGVLGKMLNVLFKYGIYEGAYFEKWLDELLVKKGKTTFGDIRIKHVTHEKYRYKFQAIASDITSKRMLVLPGDLKEFGFDPDKFSISRAVRMSMSIPLYFDPVRMTDKMGKIHYIVDGGLLSNYPIWLLDDGTKNPPWPTFGFKLYDKDEENRRGAKINKITNIIGYFEYLIGTMLDAHDKYHISELKGDFERTILIPTDINIHGRNKSIMTTDFKITHEESKALFKNGVTTARKFLEDWDFGDWKRKYRRW
jgi:NTE family protein